MRRLVLIAVVLMLLGATGVQRYKPSDDAAGSIPTHSEEGASFLPPRDGRNTTPATTILSASTGCTLTVTLPCTLE